jgi:uncharacterized membrane protein
VLVTIIGMAVVTYATRVSGFMLIGRMRLTPRVAAWLHYVPGAVLISIIAPAALPVGVLGGGTGASGALTGGPAEAVAALVAVTVAVRTRNLLVTMAAGVLAAWALRHIFGG